MSPSPASGCVSAPVIPSDGDAKSPSLCGWGSQGLPKGSANGCFSRSERLFGKPGGYPVQHLALESIPRGYRAPDGHFKRVSGVAPCPGEHSTGVSRTRCFLRGRDRKKALLLRFACGPFPVCRGRRLFFSHSSPPAVNLVVSSSQFAVFPVYLPKPRLAILPPVSILRYGVVAGAAARPAAEDAFDA